MDITVTFSVYDKAFDVRNDYGFNRISFDITFTKSRDFNPIWVNCIWLSKDGKGKISIDNLPVMIGEENDYDSISTFFGSFDFKEEIRKFISEQEELEKEYRDHIREESWREFTRSDER